MGRYSATRLRSDERLAESGHKKPGFKSGRAPRAQLQNMVLPDRLSATPCVRVR